MVTVSSIGVQFSYLVVILTIGVIMNWLSESTEGSPNDAFWEILVLAIGRGDW